MADLAARVRERARAEIERRRQAAALKEKCEQDLLAFVRAFWRCVEPQTKFMEGWVLEAMADALMAVADGHIKRLIINVSPGSMKSLLLNCYYPAWLWGPCNMPHLRFLSASYSIALPERDNDRFRRIINAPEYQRLWGDRVTLTREGLGLVENSKTGWKRAISVGSGTTGHRADYILLDDASDPNTVESDAVRAGTSMWLREVMPDRLSNLDEGAIINIQQRTHEQDATGVLAEFGSNYTWMCIPMEFEPLRDNPVVLRRDDDGEPIQVFRDPRGLDDEGNELEGLFTDDKGVLKVRMGSPMAQAEGTLAWPERFSPEAIEALKKIKGPYAWAGQYQQSPTIRGGGIIRRDWWRYWSSPAFPDLGTVVVSLDTAIKEAEENDWNAWTSWGAFEGDGGAPNVILTGAERAKCPLAKLAEMVGRFCYAKKADYLIIEDKARGHDTAAEIKRQFADAPWTTMLIPANGKGAFSGDKVARLHAVSPMFSGDVRKDPVSGMDVWSGGMVWEPGKDWSQEVVDEVTSFPRGKHDDYVDSCSMALSFMRRHGVVLRRAEYDAIEHERKVYRRPPGVPYAIGS
jgi:phage terminase large subunit-like protein